MTDRSELTSLGYEFHEGQPARLTHNGVLVAETMHLPNLICVARAHLRAQSEGAAAMRQLARDLKRGRK